VEDAFALRLAAAGSDEEPVRTAAPPPDGITGVLADQHASQPRAQESGKLASAEFEGPVGRGIDKSALTIGAPRRYRDKAHLTFVASQPCLLCGRCPTDPHHVRFAQKRALGRKVSDEFTVPLCRSHHRELHRSGREYLWWQNVRIDPLKVARKLWKRTLWSRVTLTAQPGGPHTGRCPDHRGRTER
jgi:hypothetical protein